MRSAICTRRTATIVALALTAALAVSAGPASASASTTVHCGQTLTHSVRLAKDLTDCPADGLVIGADGITVDLNGHTIDGTVAQTTDCDNAPREPAGIKNGGGDSRVYDRLTIENGTLQQFAKGFDAGSNTDGMADSRLRDLTARDNSSGGLDMGSRGLFTNHNRVKHNLVTGTGCGEGIVVNSSEGSLVAGNTAQDNRSGILLCCSVDNVVRDNLVSHNAEDGIEVCCDGGDNLIEHNEVLDNANNGITVFLEAHDNVIRANHVSGNGDNITVVEGPGNSVRDNLVSDARGCPFCDPPTGFGIVVAGDADGTSVVGNRVSHTVWDAIRIGIADLDEGWVTDGAIVRNNIVRDATMDGIRVDTNTAGTVLQTNTAKRAGDDGLDVDSAATKLFGNLGVFNGDLGIEAVPGVNDQGANRARNNGNPAQCTGVACS